MSANKTRSLKSNFAWTLFGTVVFSGTNFLTQIVLAKLGTPLIVGKYALGIAITQPIIQLAQMQLRSIQATDVKDEYKFHHYFVLRLLLSLLSLVAIGFFSFIGNPLDTALVVLLTGVGLAFDSVSDVIYGLMQRYQRLDYMGTSMAAKGILNITCIAACYYLSHNIVVAMLGSVASSCIIVLFYDCRRSKELLSHNHSADGTEAGGFWPPSGRIDWSALKRLFWLAIPLGMTMLLMSLSNNTTRYFIVHYLGEKQLGIFSALGSLVIVGRTIVMSLGTTVTTRLATCFKTGDLAGYGRTLIKFAGFCALVGVGLPTIAAIAGPKLIAMIFTKDYSHDFGAFIVVLAGGGVGYLVSCIGYGLTSAGLYRVQVGWFGAMVVIAAVISWFLVPGHGLIGAAWAALIAQAVQFFMGCAILYFGLRREIRKNATEKIPASVT